MLPNERHSKFLPYSLTMQCAVVLTPMWSVTVTAYTPLSTLLYPLIRSVVSCCSTSTWTLGLVPAQLWLPPGHVASVVLTGAIPVSGSRSQVIEETSSRGPCSMWAFRTRLEPGITYTGCSVTMYTDIQWSPHGTGDRDRTSYCMLMYLMLTCIYTAAQEDPLYFIFIGFDLSEDLGLFGQNRKLIKKTMA